MAIELFAIALFFIFLVKISPITCVFFDVFGIPCPGCGMSRALFSLLQLDFKAAFMYHPLIFVMPFIGGYIIKNRYLQTSYDKNFPKFIKITCLMFIILYIIRLVLIFPTVPLVINEDAIIFKVLEIIKSI